MITVEHLTKYYAEHLAVDDISFEITQGHVYGFLGPNGAGKSTTMNIITGCLSATAGRVLIDGHDIFEEPDAAKRLIGYLPEHPPLYKNESPCEYLRFVAEGNAATPVTKYVRIGDSQIVYTLDDVDFGILRAASFDDLRHKEVFWADFETVTQIDIALEGETHAFISKPEGEGDGQERAWYYGDTQLDITDVQAALEALCSDSFTQELPSEKEIGMTLHLDNESFPTVEIRLYRYDGALCLAVVDGDPVSLVSRASVMELVEAVQAIVLNPEA